MTGRGELATALRDTTLALSTTSSVGTEFFVAPGLVLTCAHVVGNVSSALGSSLPTVRGLWRDQPLELQVVPEWFLPKDDGGPDLALLRIVGEVTHPVAAMAGIAEPGDDLWAYGYPDGCTEPGTRWPLPWRALHSVSTAQSFIAQRTVAPSEASAVRLR